VVPLTLTPSEAIPDPKNLAGVALPEHVRRFALEG
jgi:hypothetical protein